MLLMEYEYFQGLGPYVSWWNVCLACMHSSVPRTIYTKYGISCLLSESSEDRGMRKRSSRLVWETWESVSKLSPVRIQSFAYCLYIELQSVFTTYPMIVLVQFWVFVFIDLLGFSATWPCDRGLIVLSSLPSCNEDTEITISKRAGKSWS